MPAQAMDIETRINALNSVLTYKTHREKVGRALRKAQGDWPAALQSLQAQGKGKLNPDVLKKVDLANSLADLSGDHVSVVKALAEDPRVTSLRDVALHFNVDTLTALVDPQAVPKEKAGASDAETQENVAVAFRQNLFAVEPTAVLRRMVEDVEIPVAETTVRAGVTSFLANQPDFNIRTTSVYAALKQPDAFKDIAEEDRPAVIEQLKTLQRVQALSPIPEAVPVLMTANLTSAFQVAEMPETAFLSTFSPALGEANARQVYTNALNNRIRNEQALVVLRELVRPTGVPAIDGDISRESNTAMLQQVVDTQGVQLNLEAMFGSMDYCECQECMSVYSPAAYFVELLQYLRNNNLDPTKPNPGQKGYADTPLEKLFYRRPDLKCLELTCENTNTILPYIDLVNEVMESFVVHVDEYSSQNHPKQARLETFNVEDEISSELLAQPQHTNYQAYCILKRAVYPFTLPYHQPIDAARIFLKHLRTSRYELLDTYRTANETCDTVQLSGADQEELQTLHHPVLERATDAEFLGLTQEEYIILTKEAFWPSRYFELTRNRQYTVEDYRRKIGVKEVHEYYGYDYQDEMLNLTGLTFVKKQFLPRTGLQYTDLVELLKTRFINPNYPQGKALKILESIRFNYRFLQALVDKGAQGTARFAFLIAFLEATQWFLPKNQEQRVDSKGLAHWVHCYFERVGKLIVLDAGEKPRLPIEGTLYAFDPAANAVNRQQAVGILQSDGTILDTNGAPLGNVQPSMAIKWLAGDSLGDVFHTAQLDVYFADQLVGSIFHDGLHHPGNDSERFDWLAPQDTCNLDKVRLVHLDGTRLTVEEYDRMQRFIRLWRKMGWTINETDKALVGLAATTAPAAGTAAMPGECDHVGFDAFQDDCTHSGSEEEPECPEVPEVPDEITPGFLHQLVAIRNLLDLSGLSVEKLLTFWADICTFGDKSLYARLFLTHNLLGIDKVFQADANGNYLTQPAKISDHVPVLMAALRLKADDITLIMDMCHLPDSLTLPNVSALYRYALLARTLHVKVADLPALRELFDDPLRNAQQTLALFETWGKMEDAGFTFRQLGYLILNHDDALRPLAPSKKTVLKLAKTLYDGLNAIDGDHPDVKEDKKEEATVELVRAKAGLLFEQAVVDRIVGLLEGTTTYTTNAPADPAIEIPEVLTKKLRYSSPKGANPPRATIQVTGILTEAERTQAKALSSKPDWSKAIDRVSKQPQNLFNEALIGIFPDAEEAKQTLVAGDVIVPAGQQDLDANTAPKKRFYFLKHFMPFLRRQLTRRFIVTTLSSVAGMASDMTDLLLSEVLTTGTPAQSAMSALEKIKDKPTGSPSGWTGCLVPPADGAFTFTAISDNKPAPLVLDGRIIPFEIQQEDPSNVWSTRFDPADPLQLRSGQLFEFAADDEVIKTLQWQTASSARVAIPSSALLPDFSTQGTTEVVVKLRKAAILVSGFLLSPDEVSYWHSHRAEFDGFDFNGVTLQQWLRLEAYTRLRNKLPKTDMTLLDLFKWASKPDNAAQLSERIAAATTWDKKNIGKLIASKHFDLEDPDAFRNEVALVKLQKALEVAGRIGVDVDRLFEWAKPTSRYWACHQIAEDISKALRARYDQEDWEKAIKPLNDQLRENQKQALISYLLVQRDLIDWGVVDADSLFEFFLIDVQMDACRETSRIKQAISTVQLFIQRCMLGLEAKHGVPIMIDVNSTQVPTLDRDRWEWMRRYRVWEVNRKVFLYPENWIEPSLRDDKSPFYKELESELLQKDINPQTVEDALKNYLFQVDEVSNLKVVGLFLEQEADQSGTDQPVKLHVFARTRNAPYFFYYRYFDALEKNWYPWEKVQVDIPSYDVEEKGKITKNGTYLIPVVWNKRLLIFFPQFAKKSAPKDTVNTQSFLETANSNPADSQPTEYWEIKMAWSEYRNGKWAQKQVSAEAIYEDPDSPDRIAHFQFIPRVVSDPPMVVIDVYLPVFDPFWVAVLLDTLNVGQFHFAGSQLCEVIDNQVFGCDFMQNSTAFHYDTTYKIHSLQAKDKSLPSLYNCPPDFTFDKGGGKILYNGAQQTFYHSFVHELLSTLTTSNLDALYAYYLNDKLVDPADAFGADPNAVYHELKQPYSLYNWEAAFHAPMLLVDRLLKAQQFDRALKMCHYVFNPLAAGTDTKRFWLFPPFKKIDAENVLEKLFMSLQPNAPDALHGQINEWRDNPFQPHVVARLRPSAYMKWVVMKYVEILIAYGDYYFRQKQNMLEAMPMAIQCYILASHILGPRGQKIPRHGKIQPQTYNSLLDKWDAFSNAMVELELVFPYSNQTPLPVIMSNGVVRLANIFGFASSLYFCIPDNPKLRELRNTIDDRLFKIRHCQDIEGIFFKPPLFEPSIEPGLLVQAASQGLSLSSVLNDLDSPMPNYRFYYLLQKALELCAELKALGNAFLAVKEKGDAEALSKLRAGHESSIHNLVMQVKKQQLEESEKSVEALQQSRKGPVYRLQHYLSLIGEDLGKVPNDNTDFSELPNQLEQPLDESGLKLIRYEKEEMDKASAAADWQIGIGVVETLASVFHALPNIDKKGQPLGVGVDVKWGPANWANATQAVARGLRIYADRLSYQSSNAGRKGGFLRQLQDRVQQANIAGYEIKNIDKQILTQQIRIAIANQEITNQQKQIDNAQEVEEFLRNKYTNQELYSWMEGQIRTLYYQAYTLAYDLAKKVEKVYRFERGLATSNFIQYGYWEPAHDGLLAGERLYIGLKQLEAAYQEKRGYDYEISKSVSLRQINPLALIQLKETGTCEFAVPEVLFDMDHPGHYMRRIKSVALTIPCVVGPYTSVNCTLRLLEHKFRTSSLAKDKNDYLEKTDEADDRFSTVNVPIASIAVSSGQNDSGVFDLNFRDERYIPFEGAGAISKWRLELPDKFRQFDYDTISDIIVHLRYTAVDGGDKLQRVAAESVQNYIKSVEELSRQEGLFAVFELKHEFPDEWYKAMQTPAGATERLLDLNNLFERLPVFTKGRQPARIQATDIYLFTSAALAAAELQLLQNGDELNFSDGNPEGTQKSFVAKDISCPMTNWQLKIRNTAAKIDQIWLLMRYVLN